uniref:Uncharacterized protein n=1 Tax=Ciona intestinalis TaxID=7719 RepID=H2XXY0_CIOIN
MAAFEGLLSECIFVPLDGSNTRNIEVLGLCFDLTRWLGTRGGGYI